MKGTVEGQYPDAIAYNAYLHAAAQCEVNRPLQHTRSSRVQSSRSRLLPPPVQLLSARRRSMRGLPSFIITLRRGLLSDSDHLSVTLSVTETLSVTDLIRRGAIPRRDRVQRVFARRRPMRGLTLFFDTHSHTLSLSPTLSPHQATRGFVVAEAPRIG